jgi:hypothetical protein
MKWLVKLWTWADSPPYVEIVVASTVRGAMQSALNKRSNPSLVTRCEIEQIR